MSMHNMHYNPKEMHGGLYLGVKAGPDVPVYGSVLEQQGRATQISEPQM